MRKVQRCGTNESESNFFSRRRQDMLVNIALDDGKLRLDSSTEEYKQLLDEKGLDYVEIEITKENGNKCKMVVSSYYMKIMTRSELNKLFTGINDKKRK